ncbi:anti-repressor SinI family protein [Neobacillus sp. KR4-4]
MPALTVEQDIDTEWLDLINEAKKIGLSIDEIRDFLNRSLGLKTIEPEYN